MEYIKNDKDHLLYPLLKDYPDPEVRFECFQNGSCYENKKEVAREYRKDFYEILNLDLLPKPRLIYSNHCINGWVIKRI